MTSAIYMPGVCRECGCTDERACVANEVGGGEDGEDPTTCYWVEPDLCSECVEDAAPE